MRGERRGETREERAESREETGERRKEVGVSEFRRSPKKIRTPHLRCGEIKFSSMALVGFVGARCD